MCAAAVNHNPMEKARSLCKVPVQEGCRKPTWDGCGQRGKVWVPHGSRLLASEVPARAMAAVSVNTRVGDGSGRCGCWCPPTPPGRGTCVRKQRAAARLWGGEPLRTVARGKTKFGLTEGKGKCGFAFTPAANLDIGSLFFFLRRLMKILLRNLHLYPLRSIKNNPFAYREETLLIHSCLVGVWSARRI